MLVRFGKCCQPLPGERIAGFITRGRGVTVHAHRLPEGAGDRSAAARRRGVGERRRARRAPVTLEVTCVDQPGLLAAMSQGDQLDRRQHRARPGARASATTRRQNTFELMVASIDELNLVMRNLGRVRGVMKVHAGARHEAHDRDATTRRRRSGRTRRRSWPGDLVFCAGQIGLDPATGKLVTGGTRPSSGACSRTSRPCCARRASPSTTSSRRPLPGRPRARSAARATRSTPRRSAAPHPARATVQVAALPRGRARRRSRRSRVRSGREPVALDGLRRLLPLRRQRVQTRRSLRAAADARAHALQVRPPHALRLVVRVAHAVADRALLAADVTCARHRGPGGTMAAPRLANGRALRRPRGCGRMSSVVETPGTSVDALDAPAAGADHVAARRCRRPPSRRPSPGRRAASGLDERERGVLGEHDHVVDRGEARPAPRRAREHAGWAGRAPSGARTEASSLSPTTSTSPSARAAAR